MRRRDFISLIGKAAAAWPLAARAQQAAKLLIGFLSGGAPNDPNISAFLQGLKEGGYVEGQSVAIEYRFANGQYKRTFRGLVAMSADDPNRTWLSHTE